MWPGEYLKLSLILLVCTWRFYVLGGDCTIVSDHIMHLTSGIIAVLVRIEESSLATDTRETAQCAETRRASADDDDIVVGLRDGGSRDGRAAQGKGEREELGEEHLGLTAD